MGACVYGFYRDEADTLRDEIGQLDHDQCKGCLSCVQNCTENILTRGTRRSARATPTTRPRSRALSWFQSETGRIPVSGSGYGGRFSGQCLQFDGSALPNMSEIVRHPWCDGIHGREYIRLRWSRLVA